MKIVDACTLFIFFRFITQNEVYFFDLGKIDDGFDHYFIEEESVNLDCIYCSSFVFVEVYVALYFYWRIA